MNNEDYKQLQELVRLNYIHKSKHPIYDIFIYNYNPKTQFEGYWTPLTRMSRGLVLDQSGNIIIKCPPKFFNRGEELAAKINLNNARITEKLDGYYISIKLDSDYGIIISSRGSFQNKYVEAVKNFLTDEIILKMIPNYTYFCELLQNFPGDENIILTQHPTPKLVCWAIKDKDFNEIIPDEECPFPIAKELSLGEAKQYLKQKVEGIVAQDLTSFERVKIKTDYFIEHHRLIADCTEKRVWEILSQGLKLEDFDIPDELMPKMKQWADDLTYNHHLIAYTVANEAGKREILTDKNLALDDSLSPEMKSFIFTLRKKGITALDQQVWQKLKPRNVV